MFKRFRRTVTFLALLLPLPVLPVAAQSALPGKTYLLTLAERLGRAAGDAEYCGYEEDRVEDFIAKALARLAKETDDQFLLAGGRVEFNTHSVYGRSEGPEEGCEAFGLEFAKIRATLLN